MRYKKNFKYTELIQVSLAVLIFSTTLVKMPQFLPYLVIVGIGGADLLRDLKKGVLDRSSIILVTVFIISVPFFYLFSGLAITNAAKSINDLVPYTLFILCTFIFSKRVNKQILKYIFVLIVVEVLLGGVQFLAGVNYFIQPASFEFSQARLDTNLLYYRTVFGLSPSTSIFAQKILVGFILLFYLRINRFKRTLFFLLTIGLIITFNRTTIVSALVFMLVYYAYEFDISTFRKICISILLTSLGLFSTWYFWELILFQFFRGMGEVDYSGRDFIFAYFIDFIKDHILVGNYSHKLWVELKAGSVYHAHNSYLQTLANLGVVQFSLIFYSLLRLLTKNKIVYVLPIMIYSIYQYGILWGVSFLDIIFFAILLGSRKQYSISNFRK